ncbi:hypothetical protein GCM10010873_09040 [Cypionkella aquatica]|uniref:EF-hand domain-containing protein n=1 Tax=Cypionkella aquatica TaxID=1756042 RepID=A0AA37U1S3_9RHOB|nr:hypothetical protein [Cypionkella aquatica]GLS85930.1 hypothetical protein GCM10010873_09040 [Cypionkella aquatica]
MSRGVKAFCASLALLTSHPASAEVVLSQSPRQFEVEMLAMGIDPPPGFKPSADLEVMMSKASGSAESRQILQMVMQISRPGRGVENLRQQVFGRMGEMGMNVLDKPFHYVAFDQVQDARQRAQLWGQMLGADLNNDGQITKQELKDTLEFMPSEGVSDAFSRRMQMKTTCCRQKSCARRWMRGHKTAAMAGAAMASPKCSTLTMTGI